MLVTTLLEYIIYAYIYLYDLYAYVYKSFQCTIHVHLVQCTIHITFFDEQIRLPIVTIAMFVVLLAVSTLTSAPNTLILIELFTYHLK